MRIEESCIHQTSSGVLPSCNSSIYKQYMHGLSRQKHRIGDAGLGKDLGEDALATWAGVLFVVSVPSPDPERSWIHPY